MKLDIMAGPLKGSKPPWVPDNIASFLRTPPISIDLLGLESQLSMNAQLLDQIWQYPKEGHAPELSPFLNKIFVTWVGPK